MSRSRRGERRVEAGPTPGFDETLDVDDTASRGVRRAWRASLVTHALALAGVLLVAFVTTRPGNAYSADEGVVAHQVALLVDEGRWEYPYPLAEIDREAQGRPFPRGDPRGDEVVPYAKHPLYPVLLMPFGWLGGATAMVLASTLATLAAAVLTARVAEAIHPTLARPALWVTGLASPLFFDGFFLVAHSLAAAAVAAAALSCARLLHGTSQRLAWSSCLFVSTGIAVMLRSEAVFVGLGLATAAAAVWWRRRERRAVATTIAGAAVAGTVLAWAIERAAQAAILGSWRAVPTSSGVAGDFWDARLRSLAITWFEATSGRATVTSVSLTVTVFVLGVATLLYRFGRLQGSVAVVLAALAIAVYGVHLAVGPRAAIPGLMVAFPILWVGLLLVDRRALATDTAMLLTASGSFVCVAVALTQYSQGGGVEWGGRFFAVALPLLVPVVLEVFRVEAGRLPAGSVLARAAAPLMVASTVLIAATAASALRVGHDRATELEATVREAAAEAGVAGAIDRPVVVSTNRLLPQLLFSTLPDLEWLVPHRDELDGYVARLRSEGVDRFVLVTRSPEEDLAELTASNVLRTIEPDRTPYRAIVIEP